MKHNTTPRLPWLSLLSLLSCTGTESVRVTFPVEVTAKSEQLTTTSGWNVTLTSATAELSAIRFFSGDALEVRAPWWRNALVGTAYAHPGHYEEGDALGELLAGLTVDLLASEPVAWGTADGVTGDIRSQELTFGAGGLSLEGVAEKDGTQVAFAVQHTPSSPVSGAKFEHTLTTAKGTAHLQLDLQRILTQVDFAQTGSSAEPIDETSPAWNGYVRGVTSAAAYLTTWKEE